MNNDIDRRLMKLHQEEQALIQQGRYEEALPPAIKMLEIASQLESSHPAFAGSLNNLGQLYYFMSDYSRSEPLYKQALEINRQVLGEDHPTFAISLNNLAALYHAMGNYGQAEPLYKQALEIRYRVLGEDHPHYAASLNNLAGLYDSMGDYNQAEPLYNQSLEIRCRVLGEDHPHYADSLNNLAALYDSMGDYSSAEPLCKQALEIGRQVLGEDHPDFAGNLNDLAVLYESMGNDSSAEPLYKQATKGGDTIENDDISCSVYSESSVSAGKSILLQVFVHLPDKKEEATDMATMFDEEASMRGTTHLNKQVKRGADLCFYLEADEIIKVDNVAKHLKWLGETSSVQFSLSFPDNYPIGSCFGKIIITMESVPIGHILFKLKVLEPNPTVFNKAMTIFSKYGFFVSKSKTDKSVTKTKLQGEMKRYKYAFISYASPDQDEVLKRVQMLGLTGINYFQDILSLDSGVRWEKELYKHIDHSDVFFLFWSSAAKNSRWVLQEVKYALSCQGATYNGIPEIIPVILEGPPVPKPPQILSHIHFNDKMVYFIK